MVHVISNIPVHLPDVLVNMDEKSFRQFMMWQDDQKMLNRYPISKFEDALLATLPYTDENRPGEVKEYPVVVGELEFMVKTIPTHKKVSYSAVYEKFKSFVNMLEEFYKDEMLRKDFRTLTPKHKKPEQGEEKELYVKNNMILEKIREYTQKSIEGKEGIKQETNLIKPAELLSYIPEIIHVNLERNYSGVAESNARTWQEALNMIEEGNNRTVGYKIEETKEYVKRFKKLLLDDTLQILGEKPKNPVAVMYPFETVSFKHQIEPRDNISYEPIIAAFIKETPKVLKSNSTIGDLVMVNMIEKGQDQGLRDKGLIKEDFLIDYDPQGEGGSAYIRIAGLKKRLEGYTKNKTNQTIEQNFSIILPSL